MRVTRDAASERGLVKEDWTLSRTFSGYLDYPTTNVMLHWTLSSSVHVTGDAPCHVGWSRHCQKRVLPLNHCVPARSLGKSISALSVVSHSDQRGALGLTYGPQNHKHRRQSRGRAVNHVSGSSSERLSMRELCDLAAVDHFRSGELSVSRL